MARRCAISFQVCRSYAAKRAGGGGDVDEDMARAVISARVHGSTPRCHEEDRPDTRGITPPVLSPAVPHHERSVLADA
ncbi:hypothetical protein GCM10010449_48680 [Streptomyces rectiviolaceus]|uniref:Transposase n=1 Tax=Streptomyces rectiviolaceus TaxID=332591 RepID=A0ABP6MQS0_9ACTN